MQFGQQSVLIQIPVGGDPGSFTTPKILTGATGTDVEIITTNFTGLNSAACMYALDANATTRFRRLLGVLDSANTQAPQASANDLVLATMARLNGFDGTNFRRVRVDGAGNLGPTADQSVNATAAANTAVTLTLPAAGAGLFHYLTSIEIYRTATAALAGTATLVITTTNLPGSMSWSVGNAMNAGGTQIDVARDLAAPLKSSAANTATTIVMPAPGAAVLWRAQVNYYTGA